MSREGTQESWAVRFISQDIFLYFKFQLKIYPKYLCNLELEQLKPLKAVADCFLKAWDFLIQCSHKLLNFY